MAKNDVTDAVKYIFDESGASEIINDFLSAPNNRWAKWASISQIGDIEVWSHKPYPDDMQHICDALGLVNESIGNIKIDVSEAWGGLIIKTKEL